MATGSIFENIVIRGDEEAQALLDAIEKSKQMKTKEVDLGKVTYVEEKDIKKYLGKLKA